MDAESDPPDGALAPSNISTSDASVLLSDSLDHLSMNASQFPQPPPPPAAVISDPSIPQSPMLTSEPPPMRPAAGLKASAPSSRRSSAAFGPQSSPSSPKLNRRSSGQAHINDRPSKSLSRRSSSQTLSPKASAAHSSIFEEEPAPVTASSVAAEYFKRELDLHQNRDNTTQDTIVIVHDSCYGHRFSRPKISKINFSFIVERPERIKAGVLGLSSAYVRLGERHANGASPPHPGRQPSPDLPFLISKSTRSARLDSSAVTNVHGAKWMHELTHMCNAAESKLASGGKELSRPGTPSASSTKPHLHEGDLYLCKESLDAFQGALGGVLDGVDAVFGSSSSLSPSTSRYKKAFVCVRPPGHHCSADMPSGFCWLNNVHVGIEYAAQNHGLTHAAIIDFDLHHGDGSQSITWERNARAARMPKNAPLWKRTSIGYFSIHDINSYPCEDGNREKVQNASLCIENAHGQSIWNVHLQPWKSEADFWDLYQSRYLVLLDKARAFLRAQTQRIQSSSSAVKPKAAIFISAGFDASEWEGEGMQRHKVNVPTEFYARFTSDILKLAKEEGTSAEGRVVSVLEGGYSDRALMSGILSHITGLVGPRPSVVQNVFGEHNSNGYQMMQSVDEFQSCKDWWSSAALSELEAMIRPTFVAPQSRKIRNTELATYAIPTQSSTAKIVDPSKVYRSLSGAGPVPDQTKPPTPPPPEVDWATAVHELSKLLIPSDRSVDSWRHEELTEPRAKIERRSSIGLSCTQPAVSHPVPTRARRGLKGPVHNDPVPSTSIDLPIRPASNTRRRTLSDLRAIPDEQPSVPVNGLIYEAERPATSDSKTHSDGSIPRFDTSQNIASNVTTTNAAEAVKLGRTRRQSGAMADIRRMTDGQTPPIPQIPKQLKAAPKSRTSKPPPAGEEATAAGSSIQTSDIDSITSGIKKITLRMSKDAQDSKVGTPPPKPAVKAPRKPAAPRAPKASPAKPPPARTTKASKTASPAINTSSPPTFVEQPASMSTTIPDGHVISSSGGTMASTEFDTMQSTPSPKPAITAQELPAPTVQPEAEFYQEQIPPQPGLPQSNIASPDLRTLNQDDHNSGVPLTTANASFTMPVAQDRAAPSINLPTTHTEFIPYVPSSYPDPSAGIKPDTLTWLPPNTNTPTQSPIAKRGKENLPVFTKDGYIPFAPVRREQEQDVISDVPDMPREPATENNETATEGSVKRQESIWDVPVTPRH